MHTLIKHQPSCHKTLRNASREVETLAMAACMSVWLHTARFSESNFADLLVFLLFALDRCVLLLLLLGLLRELGELATENLARRRLGHLFDEVYDAYLLVAGNLTTRRYDRTGNDTRQPENTTKRQNGK